MLFYIWCLQRVNKWTSSDHFLFYISMYKKARFWLVNFPTNESLDKKFDLGFQFSVRSNLLRSFIKTPKNLKIEKFVSDWSVFRRMKAQIKNPTSDSNSSSLKTYTKLPSEWAKIRWIEKLVSDWSVSQPINAQVKKRGLLIRTPRPRKSIGKFHQNGEKP